MKTGLTVIVLLLLAAFAVVSLRRDQQRTATVEALPGAESARDPAFRVRVVVPPGGRALLGLLPSFIEDRIEGAAPRELIFEHTGPGTEVGAVGPERIELRNADGWDLSLAVDAAREITAASYITFPIYLGERHIHLRCRPSEPAVGHLRVQPGPEGRLWGSFLVEVHHCKNALSNKNVDWPGTPLEVRGTFAGLPVGMPAQLE